MLFISKFSNIYVAPTWEVQNVVVREKVTEGEGEEGGDAETPAE